MVDAPLSEIPVFVREGAIVPRGDIARFSNNWTPDWSPKLRVEIYPSEYVDSSFDYYTGSKVEKITAKTSGGKLNIRLGDLGVSGTLEIHLTDAAQVVLNGKALQAGKDFERSAAKRTIVVPFSGTTELSVF